MTITGLSGDIGSGKSWKMLQYALEQTQLKQKYLVLNFGLNLDNLKKYCALKKQWWNVYIIERGFIAVVSLHASDAATENLSLVPLFKDRENSVVLLDEAGIFVNSRNFRNTPTQLLMDLAQSRKSGNDLIWAAQFDDQVDIQFRKLTQFWIHCEGFTTYNKQMRRPELKWKTYYFFKGAEYNRWLVSSKARTSFIRTYFGYAFDTEVGPLSKADKLLFSAFDSFTRLESQQSQAREMRSHSSKKSSPPADSFFGATAFDQVEKTSNNDDATYYKSISKIRLRIAVKAGRGRWKSFQEKQAELRELDRQRVLEKYDFASIKPLIHYQADLSSNKGSKKVRLKVKDFPYSSALFVINFILALLTFLFIYQLVDSNFSNPPAGTRSRVAGD